MTEQRHSHTVRVRHIHAAALLAAISLVVMAAIAPGVMAQGTVVVTAIPGGGWFQSPDSTAGGSAQLVAGPGPGTLGNGSLQLTTAATDDFAGVTHPLGIPYSDLTGAAWRTFVTTSAASDAPSLRLAGYKDGGFSGFTTLTVELVYNGGVTPDVWQDTILDDETVVWQTNDEDDFCLNTAVSLCTFGEFKEQYPDGRFTFLTVAIGTGNPPATSYADGVSLTIDGVTETFDFDVAAAPTPTPPTPAPATPVATPAGSAVGDDGSDGGVPDTSADPSAPSESTFAIALGSLGLLSGMTVVMVRRHRLGR